MNKLSESISQHKALLDKITETLKDAPSEEELIQAKEIISPKKLDSLQTNSSKDCKQLKDIQNELNERKKTLTESFEEKNAALKTMGAEFNKQEEARRKELEDNQRARKEIFDTYNAIRDTRKAGTLILQGMMFQGVLDDEMKQFIRKAFEKVIRKIKRK